MLIFNIIQGFNHEFEVTLASIASNRVIKNNLSVEIFKIREETTSSINENS